VAVWQVWLWGLAAVQVMMVLVWVGSLVQRDASLVDRFWGVAFVVLAWTYVLLGRGDVARGWLVGVLVTVWGLRLAAYITWRNWGEGEDPRYRDMRARDPEGFAVRSLVRVFGLQGVLAWLISLPLLAVGTRSGDLGPLDALGVAVWAVGLYFEAVGDWQLQRFLADPANRGKVMDRGLWRYTRHPNYFGDTTVWVAYALFALATGWGGAYGAIGSALMALFIVRVSGLALTERRMGSSGSRREGYDEYVARTNAFFPGPPREAA
jgi:steroid 5-alpha reductase family enzyme